jgi:YD repeat-containing protein
MRGKVFRRFDGAGVLETERYDFKGNPLTSTWRFTRDFVRPPDWSTLVALERERFDSATAYDALNRVIAVTAPDGSVYRPTFNDSNLLERVEVNVRGSRVQGEPVWTRFVDFVNYDAKGRRSVIDYANGARTNYEYDPFTFRLTRLKTERAARHEAAAARIFRAPDLVQDLRYTYDRSATSRASRTARYARFSTKASGSIRRTTTSTIRCTGC